MIAGAAAAIVAGGRGIRLGRVNKALLVHEGRTILDRQLDVLRPLFGEIVAVTGEPGPFRERGLRCVEDAIPGKGAPGGVHAALAATQAAWVFAVACDMPFLAAGPIELLAGLRTDQDAVVPLRSGRPEPLHAFYARGCRQPFERALRAGEPSFVQLLRGLRVRSVDEDELRAAEAALKCLENVNTPEDLARTGAALPRR